MDLDKPFVIDADGINAFNGHLDLLKGKGEAVLTPHPGEFGRLVNMGPKEVNGDRLNAGRRFAVRARGGPRVEGRSYHHLFRRGRGLF